MRFRASFCPGASASSPSLAAWTRPSTTSPEAVRRCAPSGARWKGRRRLLLRSCPLSTRPARACRRAAGGLTRLPPGRRGDGATGRIRAATAPGETPAGGSPTWATWASCPAWPASGGWPSGCCAGPRAGSSMARRRAPARKRAPTTAAARRAPRRAAPAPTRGRPSWASPATRRCAGCCPLRSRARSSCPRSPTTARRRPCPTRRSARRRRPRSSESSGRRRRATSSGRATGPKGSRSSAAS
mmetsp:Transcript_116563/g.310086  ORF Transcript_116563/g.310086 Transcript_116563/m.310086 type:complete len:243 (+) Transcript_116563:247-975(+)